MTPRFDWEANGINRARFEALAKLLRLQSKGQVELPSRFDPTQHDSGADDESASDDADSNIVLTLTDFNLEHLQRAFLDKLATLAAKEKGGPFVAATLMVNGQDKVDVFVARNDGFSEKDLEFLNGIQRLLRLIAQGHHLDKQGDESHSSALWKLIFKYYEKRIKGYIREIVTVLKSYFRASTQIGQSTTSGPGDLDFHLGAFQDATIAEYPSAAIKYESLVFEAHYVYKRFSDEDFDQLSFSGSRKLRSNLGFLGGLETTFNILIAAAEKLPGFSGINIFSIKKPSKDPPKNKDKPGHDGWSLEQVFKHFGHDLTDDHAHSLLGYQGQKPRWTTEKLRKEFKKLKSSSSRVHAEIQLLPRYLQALENNESVIPYIGCSKHSCFLCGHFLRLFGDIKTRGCHGKLYQLWGLPEFEGINVTHTERMVASMRDLEGLLERQILDKRNGTVLEHAKESTVGASSIETVIPVFEMDVTNIIVSRYLENQRANARFQMTNEEESEYAETIAPMIEENINATPIARPCQNSECRVSTIRRCSHCAGAWFCSNRCEKEEDYLHKFKCNRRSITTADLLERDCASDLLPEDTQVREDYGFQRCKNRDEEVNLFGLYIGILIPLKVPSETLHHWRTEGILVDKIIDLFSELPEHSRGGYYPWFLRNKHILNSDHIVNHDMEDESLIDNLFKRGSVFLDAEDQAKAIKDLRPFAKPHCLALLSMLLGFKHPRPVSGLKDCWYDFGFVVCSNPHEESKLASYYRRLLLGENYAKDDSGFLVLRSSGSSASPTCSFTEFWKAWEAGSLMELFDRYGVSKATDISGEGLDEQFPSLRDFLSYAGPDDLRPSVWRLKRFLAIEDANVLTIDSEVAAAAIEYGFNPGLNTRTRLDLHEFYTRVFERRVSPTKMEKIMRKGKLLGMAERWSGREVDERVKLVLKGVPYTKSAKMFCSNRSMIPICADCFRPYA